MPSSGEGYAFIDGEEVSLFSSSRFFQKFPDAKKKKKRPVEIAYVASSVSQANRYSSYASEWLKTSAMHNRFSGWLHYIKAETTLQRPSE